MILSNVLSQRQIFVTQLILALFFSFFPLFIELPYRSTIYLTWEGAYRMYMGQMPFKDFGMPMGYGFWIIPFLFFKIFGPYMYTLVIAQSVINLVSLIVLNNILKLFKLSPIQILLTTVFFCLSFVLINFWPWYNHTVFFFELIGLYFIIIYIVKSKKYIFIICGAIFIALSFFTKQDTGGFALLISICLLLLNLGFDRTIKPMALFVLVYGTTLAIFILPLTSYDFGYWFNYGQAPHFSRINLYDFFNAFFEESLWLKFYIITVLILATNRFKTVSSLKEDKTFFFFTIFTLAILIQVMIVQVTTYTPITSNIYYHTFGIAFIVYSVGTVIQFEKVGIAVLTICCIFFWQSQNYWKYTKKIMGKVLPAIMSPPPSTVVSMNTWSSNVDTLESKPLNWSLSKYRSLKRIKLPQETIEGLKRMEALPVVKGNHNLSCLNMSNLTSLAYDLNYPLSTGRDYPLWFHKGVIIFERETRMMCEKVQGREYDLILFEVEPNIDGFFSFDIRNCIAQNYRLVDTFPAPTGLNTHYIEVYIKQ